MSDVTGSGASAAPPSPIDAEGMGRWLRRCHRVLTENRAELNRLNVFPVADGDTGTNMLLTVVAALTAFDGEPEGASPAERVRAIGRGAVRGARGNSGIILSQLFRAVSDVCADRPLDGEAFAETLRHAGGLVLKAVSEPVEGTIISVLRAAEEAAAARVSASRGESGAPGLAEVVVVAADAAARELLRTPEKLPQLRDAGVVDSGAFGALHVLDALVHTVTGTAPLRPHPVPTLGLTPKGSTVRAAGEARPGESSHEGVELEVMYALTATDDAAVDSLRARLGEHGNSIVIVDDGSVEGRSWTVHVHTPEPGLAVEQGIAAGTIADIRITTLDIAGDVATEARRAGREPGGLRALVALSPEGPVAELFRDAGALVHDRRPGMSLEDVLEIVAGIEESDIILLPNGRARRKELSAIDAALETMAGKHVLILPTSSLVQGLAAIAVHEPSRSVVVDAYLMTEAASDTRRAALTLATERALTFAGTCEPGDVLGTIGNDVLVVAGSQSEAGRKILEFMLQSGGEIVTVLLGDGVDDRLPGALESYLAECHPEITLNMVDAPGIGDILQLGVE